MIDLPQLKARIARRDELERGLVAEAAKCKGAKSLLPPGEREQYLESIQAAAAGLYDARATPEAAVQRLEAGGSNVNSAHASGPAIPAESVQSGGEGRGGRGRRAPGRPAPPPVGGSSRRTYRAATPRRPTR